MQFQRRPNSDRSPESLEARLCALPQPPIPVGLEARILAAIPARPSNNDELPRLARSGSRRWRLIVWAGASVAAAAACLLAVRFWPEPDDQHTAPILVADPGSTKSLRRPHLDRRATRPGSGPTKTWLRRRCRRLPGRFRKSLP